MPTEMLDDQWTYDGLVVSGVEQKAWGTGLGRIQGTFNTRGKKNTITGSSKNTDPVVVSGGMTSQMQVLNIAVNTLQKPPNAAVLWVTLDRGPCFEPTWKNQEVQWPFFVSGS